MSSHQVKGCADLELWVLMQKMPVLQVQQLPSSFARASLVIGPPLAVLADGHGHALALALELPAAQRT
jgi:hypothetical protein